MRLILRLFLLLLVGLPLLAVGLVYLAVDDTALVQGVATLTPAHVQRARWLLDRNDPRTMRPGVLRTIVVSEEDLDIATNYLAHQFGGGASKVALHDGGGVVRASLALPTNPAGRFVNLDLAWRETGSLPRVETLRLGRVPVPAMLCNWLLDRGLAYLQNHQRYAAAADVVRQVRARDGFLTVDFEWNEAAPEQLKAALIGRSQQERWQLYNARLVALAGAPDIGRVVSLERLLGPLLQLAAERGAGGDAVQEYRSALVVLAFYVNGKGLAALVPQARTWPTPRRHVVTLAGRPDLTQHFTISAVLAATAGSPLSDVVGLYKELDDARNGSGFSFNDLAADRAGTRLGAMAVGAASGRERLRQAVAAGLRESDLMPEVRDLPEFMPQAEFVRRFGGVGKPPYQAMLGRIEQRLDALPLYR
ncbi:MAG: hypothetical protein H6930_13340 [Rhodoferax sp.]|jgi:uncharacterized protein YfiM (DUF2279 family)|nr:hypothetical protein [Rhodoferax sp.]